MLELRLVFGPYMLAHLAAAHNSSLDPARVGDRPRVSSVLQLQEPAPSAGMMYADVLDQHGVTVFAQIHLVDTNHGEVFREREVEGDLVTDRSQITFARDDHVAHLRYRPRRGP